MPRRQTPRLSEALIEYQAIRAAHLAKTTLANDHSVLRKFVEGVGDKQTHLLTAQDAERWFASEATRQMASSYNKVRARVASFTAFCQRRGWLTSDPMAEIRTRRVVRRERLRLSAHQIKALVASTDNPRDRAMLATAANTGMRASDLVNLRIGNIDLENGLLSIVAQKTGEPDALPITSDLMPELRTWLTYYADRMALLGQSLQADFYAFPAQGFCNVRHGSKVHVYGDPVPDKQLTHPARVVHRALKRIGIESTAQEGYHTLRRSVGRLVFEQAVAEGHDAALRVTAALLGHKNVATTEGYLGVSSDRAKRDELLRGRSFLTPNESEAGKIVHLRQSIMNLDGRRNLPQFKGAKSEPNFSTRRL